MDEKITKVSQKIHNVIEGALLGGYDPISSPLYVFGPFLKMIVTAGVAQVTFGSSIWLVILTITAASAMYRYVMRTVTDGSGGCGLCAKEFGFRAFKFNAAVSYIEYILIFLVCMSALVTFLSDRFPVANTSILGIQSPVLIAVALSIFVGWLANHYPESIRASFIPATTGVFILLWIMVMEAVIKTGFHLPYFNIEAFKPRYLPHTVKGYVRVLAVMAGIEIFANLVPEYEESYEAKSRKAFKSLLIIMITTAVTTLVLAPAIFVLSDPTIDDISVFTQAMDFLLPQPLAYAGSFLAIFVLLYACAESAHGMQKLTANLSLNHYIPESFSQKNRFKAINKPVRLKIILVCLAFVGFGLNEEFYLEMYDVGVFIIISQTGWAVMKHLVHEMNHEITLKGAGVAVAAGLTIILTTGATIVIFLEHFFEGAWLYFIIIPIFIAIFSHYHRIYRDNKENKEPLKQSHRHS